MNFDNIKIMWGIDPSFTKMGACIYIPDGDKPIEKRMFLRTSDFDTVIEWLQKETGMLGYKLSEVGAIVENPDGDSPTFGMWAMVRKQIQAVVNSKGRISIETIKSPFLIAMNKAQKVGKNKQAAIEFLKQLEKAGIPYLEIKPSQRDRAFKMVKGKEVRTKAQDVKFLKMPTKTDADQFKALTGFGKRCSFDSRDAATLVFGRKLPWLRMELKKKMIIETRKPASYPSTTNGHEFLVRRT